MSLPPEVQRHVDAIRVLLGVPACQLTINMDAAGIVQTVQPLVTFRRMVTKSLDNDARRPQD